MMLTTILPEMALATAIDTARLPRVGGLTAGRTALVTTRPWRATHQTCLPKRALPRSTTSR